MLSSQRSALASPARLRPRLQKKCKYTNKNIQQHNIEYIIKQSSINK